MFASKETRTSEEVNLRGFCETRYKEPRTHAGEWWQARPYTLNSAKKFISLLAFRRYEARMNSWFVASGIERWGSVTEITGAMAAPDDKIVGGVIFLPEMTGSR